MKKIYFLLSILFINTSAYNQNQKVIDSLQIVLSSIGQDSNKANVLYQLSRAYWGNKPDKALDYANQTLGLSLKIGFKKGIGNAYNSMGVINTDNGDYHIALEMHKKALKIRKEIVDLKGISGSYNNIGNVNSKLGNYQESIKNYFYALKIREKIGDKQGIADSYNNISIIYNIQGNYPEALKNQYESLKINTETQNKKGQASNYQNIGIIYDDIGNYKEALKNYYSALKLKQELGDQNGIANSYNDIGTIYNNQKKYAEALKKFTDALKIYTENGDYNGIATSYGNIGVVYSRQGNYTEALKNHFSSLKLFEDMGCKSELTTAYVNIGGIYLKQGKYKEASIYLNKTLSISKEIGNLKNLILSYESLVTLETEQGNYKQALDYYRMYVTYHDSLFNEENTKKLVQSQMQFEFDKKEAVAKAEQEKKDAIAQKEVQKQKWLRNAFVGGFAVVLFFAFVFFRQRNKISKEKMISEAEKERSEELLLNILPSEVAAELKQTGHCQPKTFSMVTVMFADFKDFTKVSEKVSAELLVGEINYCFSAFDHIIQKYKIEKIKTVGDAYMCASGLPLLNYTHAIDVVNAALEMNIFIQNRKKEKEGRGEIAFEMRIGINTGPVVAGIVGVKKFSYDIWGDTVNLAARMEQCCEAGYVNISESTYELVKDKFHCTYRGKIQAKNKGEVDMYFVAANSN